MNNQEDSNSEASDNSSAAAGSPVDPAPLDPTKTHQVADFKHDKPLTTCRIDPLGQYVFAGAEDSHVYRWDLNSGDKVVLSGHDSWIRALDFSCDGQWLYTAGWDGQLRWWATNIAQPEPIRMIQAHRGFARWVQASPCGTMLATCGNDKMVRVWDAKSGKNIAEMTGHQRHPYAVVFHPRDGHLASQDLLGVIRVWDLPTSSQVATIDASVMTGYDQKFAADMGGARDMRFHPDGSVLACAGITNVVNAFAGSQDPIIVLVDWETKKITHHLKPKGGTGIAWGVRFHPDGFIAGAIAGAGGKGQLLFWRTDQATAESVAEQPESPTVGEDETDAAQQPIVLNPFHTLSLDKAARGMDFTPDGRRIAIADSDGHLRVYEMAEEANTEEQLET